MKTLLLPSNSALLTRKGWLQWLWKECIVRLMNDENIHIGALLRLCFKCWKIYLPIVLFFMLGAVIFLLVVPKEHEFTARMQLIDERQDMMSELKMLKSSGLGALLGGKSSGVGMEDKVIVMKSRTTLGNVIRRTEYQTEVRKRRWLKKELLYGLQNPLEFRFQPMFLDTLSKPVLLTLTIEDGRITAGKIRSKAFETVKITDRSLPCVLNLPVGEMAVSLKPEAKIPEEQTFYCEIKPLQTLYEELYEDIYADAEERVSDIILLSFDNENKERGTAFLNEMMAEFNLYFHEVKIRETELTARFVQERLDSVAAELALLEYKIENYQKENNIPEPVLYAKSAIAGHWELESSILETEAKLKMLDYVVAYMGEPENEFSSIPVIEGVGEKSVAIYNQLVLDRQRLALSSEPGNPVLALVNRQLAEQRNMLMGAIDAARKSMRASLGELARKNNALSMELHTLPTKEREYVEMKRQQKIKETIYLFLMQKLQEKELVKSPDKLAGRVIDKAYASAKPVFPKTSIVLGVAFLLACMLSLVVIVMRISALNKKR